MAHNKESKFFLSGTVSPVSVFKLNLHPKRCMPRMLEGEKEGTQNMRFMGMCSFKKHHGALWGTFLAQLHHACAISEEHPCFGRWGVTLHGG